MGMAETVYATGGALKQDGPRRVNTCDVCGCEFVWVQSARTGRFYRADVQRGYLDQRFYMKNRLHECAKHQASQDAAVRRNTARACADEYRAMIEIVRAEGGDCVNDPRLAEIEKRWDEAAQ